MTEAPSLRAEAEALYRRYGALVERRCLYLLGDRARAADACHDVFVRVLRALPELENHAQPTAWILRITTNHCLNVIAAERAPWHRRFFAREQHRRAIEEATTPEDVERVDLVRRILSRLDAETQAVAIHYYVDEMTQEEIGALLGRSLPTIRKRLEKFERVARREAGEGGR